MTEESTAYRWFWQKMNALTESKPMSDSAKASYKTEKSLEKYRRFRDNLDLLNEFFGEAKKFAEELEKAGIEVTYAKSFIGRLAGPINILNTVVGAQSDAIEAAEEVSLQLATWYHKAEQAARAASGGDDDQYFILSAAIARLWQARNVKAVLGTQTDSFVTKLWPKWRDRIFTLVF